MKNKELLISDVKKFLKNSFDNLEYDNISVVLSPLDKVQRAAPAAMHKSAPSHELVLSAVAGILCLLLLIFLCLKKSNPALVQKLKVYGRPDKLNAPGDGPVATNDDEASHAVSAATDNGRKG